MFGGPSAGPSQAELERATQESRGNLQWAFGLAAFLYTVPWVVELVKQQLP
ncbi:hypothetical protein PYCC9005_002561 [Savitreella phatthalungensis]